MNFFKIQLKSYFIPEPDIVSATKKLSITDGLFWAAYSTMTTPFLVPLSILLFGVNAPVGYITGIPVFLVPLAQLYSVKVSQKTQNLKRMTVFITFLDRLLWIPVVFLIFIPGYYEKFVLMIALLSLRTFFASASGTTWTLWVPTIIPSEDRNTYFAKRNFIMKIFSLFGYFIALLIFAGIKDYEIALATVFLSGVAIFSSISLYIMTRMPNFSLSNEDKVKKGKMEVDFKSFLFFVILFYLGSSMLMPYFQLYIISRDFLSLSPSYYTLIFVIISISSIMSQLKWGKLSERWGVKKTIFVNLVILLIAIILIICSKNAIEIIIPSILYGISQSGLGLTLFTEMIGRAKNTKIRSVSFYNLFQSLASAAGPIIANFIFVFSNSNILNVFLLSLFLLMVASIYFLSEKILLKHDRHKDKFRSSI